MATQVAKRHWKNAYCLPIASRGVCADERVQDRAYLHMGPSATPGRADIALVKLRRNGIVARGSRPPNLLDDWPNVRCKPLRGVGLDCE